jgi:FkbM family methyltransferase
MKTENFRKILKVTSPIISKVSPQARLSIAKYTKIEWIRTLLDPNSMRNYARLSKKSSIKKIKLNSGLEMFVDLNDIMGYRTALNGKWDDTALNVVIQFSTEGTIYIDIGANIGLTCIPIANLNYKTIAFEPNPIALELLTKNVALNSPTNFYLFPFAVSSNSEELERLKIFVPKGNIGASSINSKWSPGVDELSIFNVPTVSLQAAMDLLFPNNSVKNFNNVIIKLDIEGHEDTAMKGTESLISQLRPVVIFENNPTEKNFEERFWSKWLHYEFVVIKDKNIETFDQSKRYENVIAIPLEKREYLIERLKQSLTSSV